MPLYFEEPLADYACGRKNSEERGLSPIAQEKITEGRAYSPEQDTGGPIFVQIENLSGEKNGRAKRCSAERVQNSRKRRKTVGEERTADVENGSHQKHQRKARSGGEFA